MSSVETTAITVQKKTCPECGKKIIHLAHHVRRNHPKPKVVESIPDPVIELEISAPPTPALSTPPPSPPPLTPTPPPPAPIIKPTFATVAATNSDTPTPPPPASAFTVVTYKPKKPASPSTLPYTKVLDEKRVVRNVLKPHYTAMKGRKTEWNLLTQLWNIDPDLFQISKQHSTPSNPDSRITITIYKDQTHMKYSQYHLYLNPAAFGQVLYIDGNDCGESYKLIDFRA